MKIKKGKHILTPRTKHTLRVYVIVVVAWNANIGFIKTDITVTLIVKKKPFVLHWGKFGNGYALSKSSFSHLIMKL